MKESWVWVRHSKFLAFFIFILQVLINWRAAWDRVILEKLTNSQLVRNSLHFVGPQGSLSLSQEPTTCPYSGPDRFSLCPLPPSTSWISILTLSSHLCLGLTSGLFPPKFPHQNPVCTSPLLRTWYMPLPSHSSFYHPNNISWWVDIIKLLIL